jgi:hypothetical protein
MSIQTIIDLAQEIEFDRRRIAAQTFSRSQRIKTAERATAQPWRWVVTPPGSMPYSTSRPILEVITSADRVDETEVNLAAADYLVKYQGALTQAQINDLNVSATSTSTLTLNTLPAIGSTGTTETISSSTVVFAQGDVIQPENSRYPYTVTETVTRGSGSTITISLHRPVITSEGITLTGNGVKVGSSCTWRMMVLGLPTYRVVPYNRIQWTGNFDLIEKVI